MSAILQPRIGLYAGTFDPVTFGHLDIIKRAARLVDTLVVGVAEHTGKETKFSSVERASFITSCLTRIETDIAVKIQVQPFSGLLVEYVRSIGASTVFRGLRAVADFDYEFQMAMMNTRLAPDVETVFLMASERHQFIASKLVKEVAKLGGDVSSFVPQEVVTALKIQK